MPEMPRTAAIVLALLLAIGGGLPITAVGGMPGATADATPATPANHTETATVTAGESLSGAFATHGADLEGELSTREIDASLERANASTRPNETRSAVLAERLEQTRARLTDLEQRRAALVAAREREAIDDRTYRVRATRLAAEMRATERVLARETIAANRLPPEFRQTDGLEVATFSSLQNRVEDGVAGELASVATLLLGDALVTSNPEVNGSAAGSATVTWTPWNPNDTASTDRARIEFAADRLETLRVSYEEAEDRTDDTDREVEEALACVAEQLDRADAAIVDARQAAQRGDSAAVNDHLADAHGHFEQAAACLRQAYEASSDDGSEATPTRTPYRSSSSNWTYTYTDDKETDSYNESSFDG